MNKAAEYMRDNPPPRVRGIARTYCPECGNGRLRWNGVDGYECDGLKDPENNHAELEPCCYWVARLPASAGV